VAAGRPLALQRLAIYPGERSGACSATVPPPWGFGRSPGKFIRSGHARKLGWRSHALREGCAETVQTVSAAGFETVYSVWGRIVAAASGVKKTRGHYRER
jgi:hypothetical protein